MSSEDRQLTINPPVFFASATLLIAFLAFGVFAADTAQEVLPKVLAAVTEEFGWLYVLSVVFFIGFCLWLASSKYGKIRLGDDASRPEFSNTSWFAMLFSAGMGIGLVFFGVAEPMSHFNSPPVAEAGSVAAARAALPLTYLHWGLHAWAIYALMALGIGYFAFRKKLPLAIRSCFYPLLGERIHGWPGHLIDILAVLGTLFGLATSLGLGAGQVSAGLHRLFGTPHTTNAQLVLIGVITAAATVSLVTGVDKGIKTLSELNLGLAALLMVFVFLVGPTLHLVNSFVENLGGYAKVIFERTLLIEGRSETEAAWIKDWTVFYWGWWISWAPFVGMFVARNVRGAHLQGAHLPRAHPRGAPGTHRGDLSLDDHLRQHRPRAPALGPGRHRLGSRGRHRDGHLRDARGASPVERDLVARSQRGLRLLRHLQ